MGQKYFRPEIECASRDALHALQSYRLRMLVMNCYENLPFYREKMDAMGLTPGDIMTVEDIVKLPFTVKDDLRDNYPFGLFARKKGDLVRIHASSGTTGKPTVVGYTQNDLDVWADGAARAIVAAGGTKEDTVHVSYGYGLFTGGLGLHYGAEKLGATAIPVSSGNTKRQIQILQDFGSDILCCTPSYAMLIGETCRDMGIDTSKLPLRAGIFGAEAWSENMRREIEESLNIKAYDIYGLSEVAGPGVSYECSEQTGMHVCEDYFYPEIINPETGEVLPDGEFGELVFTCIGKEAMPLMRYRTRDICALTRGTCACGRTHVKMARPRGRTDDMLIIRGVNVFPSQIEHVLLELGMSPNYQIVVTRENNLDRMEVQVETTPEMFSDEVRRIEMTERKMASALQSVLNVTAGVKFVEPKSIERSQGKAKRVIDLRKI
ncbi:MAG TPA: phenylacetate--CoA ligase [Ruminococcaceae bacterium]|nr:phenylacetate--CoA ligase [Oscillospiraceae bacterium]